MASSDIITGQFVCIEQTPASVGERILGSIIDYTVLILYDIGALLLMEYLSAQLKGITDFIYLAVALLPVMFYSFICELLFNGQSLGKRILGTRVVMADGSSPSAGALLLRWMLIPVDVYLSCLGLLFIICTRKNQRIGDLAAGTMVIKKPDMSRMRLSLSEFGYARRDYHPAYPEAQNLSYGQAEVIRKALEHDTPRNAQHINALAAKVAKHLGVTPKGGGNTDFLRTILHDYQFYALELV